MQDLRLHMRQQSVTHLRTDTTNPNRPIRMLPHINLSTCSDIEGHQLPQSSSSEDNNSPTEMNSCRRLIDKPTLVKRLTMGIGLCGTTEDARPLVHATSPSMNASPTHAHNHHHSIITDGYVNEAICDPDKLLSNRTNHFMGLCEQTITVQHQQPFYNNQQQLHVDQQQQKQQLRECNDYNYNKNNLRSSSSYNGNTKLQSFAPVPSTSQDNLSRNEQNELKGMPWFQAGIPREISLEVLSRQNPGAFLVRQSTTKPGCFALSLRVPPPAPKVAHYLILRTRNGYKIKGFKKEFPSLLALITHHSVMPELLPVPLALPRLPIANRSDAIRNGGGQHNDNETYGSLNDFRNMMADLNI